MEKVNEGYLLGNYHLDLTEDERELLVTALSTHLQVCSCYEVLENDFVLTRDLLHRLGVDLA